MSNLDHHDNEASNRSDTARGQPLAAAPALVDDLVAANRILFQQGVLDAFGHVSVRHDKDPRRFLQARNMAPARVTAEDILEFTLDGDPINAKGQRVYLERFIHGEIYRTRPDVMAIVHSHSPSVVPFGVVKNATLRPICHMAGFMGTQVPVFEIRDAAGDGTDLLVTNRQLGASLAQTLGSRTVVLMRGHGDTVVAESLKKVVYRAVYTETNARMQLQATQLGEVTYLSEREGLKTLETVEGQAGRAWDLWKEMVQAR
ncbi:HCOMODA/2-hydroxy-3-carboxy-muconic semialdehyde decarboxylase OS=Castellaniella defragrans OX=75697 GN=HNR28_000993 PE=4 SV=1 [Castellaniella defragrans]